MGSNDSETFFDDPVDNSTPENVEPELEVEEGEEQSETPVEEEEEEKSFLAGTNFKKGSDLAKAYKELQASFTRRSQEYTELQGLLKQAFPYLTARQSKEAVAEVKEDPDAFMKAFVSDPKKTLLDLIKTAQQTSIKEIVEPLQGEVRGLSGNLELQKFQSNHPEFEESDVDDFLKIVDGYPEVRSRKDRLEVWYRLFLHERPDIGQRTTEQKKGIEQGVSDAKRAASLGGKKSSTPKQAAGDEFDEILSDYKARQDKYKY